MKLSMQTKPFRMQCTFVALVLLTFSVLVQAKDGDHGKSYLVYVGTTSGTPNQAIYAFRFDPVLGRLTPLGMVAEVPDPTFLAVSSDQRFLYAANAISEFEGKPSGSVSAFRIDRETGALEFLNAVSSQGAGPCYVAMDKTGSHLLVANYGSGSVAVLPMLKDGRLGTATSVVPHSGHGVNPERQEGPHAHAIETSNDNRFAISPDLGLDKLFAYRFDALSGTLAESVSSLDMTPGSGPRHVAFHPNGKQVFAVSEMGSTVSVLEYSAKKGGLRLTQTVSTLPEKFAGTNHAAEIAVSADGKFLYVSNRGDDSIAIFAIGRTDGKLARTAITPTQGKIPRHFSIAPDGNYLLVANEKSNNLVIFRIDRKHGGIVPSGETASVPSPRCLQFVEAR
jgi:6-phosphogluconolactonase